MHELNRLSVESAENDKRLKHITRKYAELLSRSYMPKGTNIGQCLTLGQFLRRASLLNHSHARNLRRCGRESCYLNLMRDTHRYDYNLSPFRKPDQFKVGREWSMLIPNGLREYYQQLLKAKKSTPQNNVKNTEINFVSSSVPSKNAAFD